MKYQKRDFTAIEPMNFTIDVVRTSRSNQAE